MENVLTMILAGGRGERLMPLTRDRAKPAVPFGGRYRIIDFVLSNFVNSGFTKLKVLTQYKNESLDTHISRGWRLATVLDQYIETVPPQQRMGPKWYEGNADAIYQNLNLILDEAPDYVAVFGSDHIYKMDVRQMLEHHIERGADLTVAAIPVPQEDASSFGVITMDNDSRIVEFREKPADPPAMPARPGWSLASMGNYIFNAQVLVEALLADAQDPRSAHDFGRNIVTQMIQTHRVFAYDFATNKIPGQPLSEDAYWRDVGTIDAYHQASLDLVSITPAFDLYNRRWPIRTHHHHHPPAKFVHDDVAGQRVGQAINSIVAEGCIISGGRIEQSVLFPQVRVNSYSHVSDSILFEGVNIGRHAKLRRCVVDKDVEIPAGAVIGYDLEADRQRFHVSPGGIVVIGKGELV